MADDIVTRLRHHGDVFDDLHPDEMWRIDGALWGQAADEIERLRGMERNLRALISAFATAVNWPKDDWVGQVRAHRAATEALCKEARP